MIQLKEVNSSSAQDVKSQVDLQVEQKQRSERNTISIQNKQALIQSLRKSYQKSIQQQECKLSNTFQIFNCLSYFLETFWNQIIPEYFKPKPHIKIASNNSEYFSTLKRKGNLIDEGSITFCLDVCYKKKRNFIIIVYEDQQNLFKLNISIKQKIKDYIILPINRHNSSQLHYLSIDTKTGTKNMIYVCRFNFAGELTIFYQIDTQISQQQFNAHMAVAQFSINDYLQFQEHCLNNFKNNENNLQNIPNNL